MMITPFNFVAQSQANQILYRFASALTLFIECLSRLQSIETHRPLCAVDVLRQSSVPLYKDEPCYLQCAYVAPPDYPSMFVTVSCR